MCVEGEEEEEEEEGGGGEGSSHRYLSSNLQ
jgi:hypothetical protein